jgi:flavin-dependent thymidylate synthase
MALQKPKIELLSFTSNPLATMSFAWKIMHNSVPDTLEEYITENWGELAAKEKFADDFREMAKNGIGTPVEYVNTVWLMKGVSRAFQQQLTRYRVGTSFSIQSLRCCSVENFAESGAYHVPDSLNGTERAKFETFMFDAQRKYQQLLQDGVKVEDARGILPLNIHSNISVAMNLRALSNIVSQRTCIHTQGEWKEVVAQMKQQIEQKMDPVIAEVLFKKPCECGKCLIPEKSCNSTRDFFRCECCGELKVTPNKLMPSIFTGWKEMIVCDDCKEKMLSESYRICSLCGELHQRNTMELDNSGAKWKYYCEECQRRR